MQFKYPREPTGLKIHLAFQPIELERELAEFEAQFTESLDYKFNNNSIKLIGYKKIKIPDHELSEFEDHYFNNHAEWKKIKSVFYDSGSTILRVYFPVEAALIEHNGKVFEANHLGELELEEISGDCAVLGRKQTDYVTGVEGNVIKDGIIYLANRNRPHHQLGKVYVYDFVTDSISIMDVARIVGMFVSIITDTGRTAKNQGRKLETFLEAIVTLHSQEAIAGMRSCS
ncbi:10666_t:CDS:2 [Racocetra fulgida]|uniref:10666_t:CDS:1 n=1 Tax=Racocetra fulgida TaxID=60492 RepID=A0A9N8Z8D8_9GLOM|nr:10666_t:CDS:2 [Racocetra fulgida]